MNNTMHFLIMDKLRVWGDITAENRQQVAELLENSSPSLFWYDTNGCIDDAEFCNKGTADCCKKGGECSPCYSSTFEFDLLDYLDYGLPIGYIADCINDILKDFAEKEPIYIVSALNRFNAENRQADLIFSADFENCSISNKTDCIKTSDLSSILLDILADNPNEINRDIFIALCDTIENMGALYE